MSLRVPSLTDVGRAPYAWQPDDPAAHWQRALLPAEARVREFADDGALRRGVALAAGERLSLPPLRSEVGTSLRAKLGALDASAKQLTLVLHLRAGGKRMPLLAIPGSTLATNRCLTVEVSLPEQATDEPYSLEMTLDASGAPLAMAEPSEPTPAPATADEQPVPATAAIVLCELLLGRPDQMARLAALANYRWRSDNERGHFSAVYRDGFFGPRANGATGAGRAALRASGGLRPDAAQVREELMRRLEQAQPQPGEDAFGFAQRLLADSLQPKAPDFLARCETLAQRPPGSLPLRVLSILCGSARVEQELLERCQAPVEMILFDFNADLLAEAASRMPARHRVIALHGDINDGVPDIGAVDVVLCVSALHHVVELERVLGDAARLLADDGEFWSIGEYVGRNGSRLGPDEYARADALFRSFPERIRRHRILQRVDARLPNFDCSTSSFEGVRAEDVLDLLHCHLEPEREHLRNCFLWRLTDPAYGPNFRIDDPSDVGLLRRCVAEEVLCWLEGGRATELNGIYRKRRPSGLSFAARAAERLVDFTCNVCGVASCVPMARLSREEPSCAHCGATVRMRAMVHLLSVGLFGDSRPLVEFPFDRGIRGVGLSDWPGYAKLLAERFDYRNTYYHAEPRLDITQPPPALLGTLDFIISSDVFEHVAPPVDRAFAGAAALLKPGGLMVFSVPYGFDAATVEHYPELHDFRVEKKSGKYVLVNRTREGKVQTYPDPVFHGGPGQTLELRLFCFEDIRRRAAAVGLDVTVLEDPVWRFGIYDPHPWSRPMLMRKVRSG